MQSFVSIGSGVFDLQGSKLRVSHRKASWSPITLASADAQPFDEFSFTNIEDYIGKQKNFEVQYSLQYNLWVHDVVHRMSGG
jgi:hypothetical protein